MQLIPITQEEIRLAKGLDKHMALTLYHAWLKKARAEDKRIERRLTYLRDSKKRAKYLAANRERIKEYQHNYLKKNRAHITLMRKLKELREKKEKC